MSLEGLAWALVHSTWQGALMAGLGGIAIRVLHRAPAELRYRVLGALLAAQVAWFGWTAALLSGAPGPAVSMAPLSASAGAWWPIALVVGWSAGSVLLALRVLAGLVTVQLWRRRSIAAPPEWQDRLDELSIMVGIERKVVLRLVAEGVPMALGLLRPAVLLPVGLFTQLPPDQLEAILLHELAHVRRWDWLFNLAQAFAETLLFHHPATWWLSARIRHERELCCDELAARVVANPLVVARALTELEALRTLNVVLAATGGNLMDRILHLLGQPRPPRRTPWVLPAVVVGVLLGSLSGVAAATSVVRAPEPVAASDAPDPADERPLQPEDVGARVLDMLADQLQQGAKSLEQKADDRYSRKHRRQSDGPWSAPAHPHEHEVHVTVRPSAPPLPPLPPIPPMAPLPPLPPMPLTVGDACHTIVAGSARVVVCGDRGTERSWALNFEHGVEAEFEGAEWARTEARAEAMEQAAEARQEAAQARQEAAEARRDALEEAAEARAEAVEAAAEAMARYGQARDWTAGVEESLRSYHRLARGRIQVDPPEPPPAFSVEAPRARVTPTPIDIDVDILPLAP